MNTTRRHILTLIGVCVFAFFVNNTVIFPDIMESRNIVTAREMVHSGEWIVPTMNGELRLEKPPLPTWIAAVVEAFSPDNIAAQRAMAGIAATALVIMFYYLVKRISKSRKAALMSGLVLCTCYNIILMGRTASWDIYCHTFMLGAVFLLYKGLHGHTQHWWRFIGAGVLMGLSFMSKGPVSFYAVLLPFLISYFIWLRRPIKGKVVPLVLMTIICLIISSWWYADLWIFHREQIDFVINKETSSWIDRSVKPWYYYSTFFLETGVWALLTLTTLLVPFWKKKLKYTEPYLFALTWMILTVVLLSLLPEKKNRYLLPVLIPASFTIATLFKHWIKGFTNGTLSAGDKAIYKVNTILISLVTFLIPVATYIFVVRKGLISVLVFILLSIVIWVISAVMFSSALGQKPKRFVFSVVALFIFAEVFCMPYIGDFANNQQYKSIRAIRDDARVSQLEWYSVKGQELRIEIVYEAGSVIKPLDIRDSATVMRALPLAILTHKRVKDELSPAILNNVDTTFIGHYDNNERPKGTSFWSDKFIYNVTILKKKAQ